MLDGGSIRDLLIEAIKGQLAKITVANGYVDDCGERVYDYGENVEAAHAPCSMVMEDVEDVDVADYVRYERKLGIVLVCVSEYAGEEKGRRARALIAAMQKIGAERLALLVPRLPTEGNPNPAPVTVYVDLVEEMNLPRISPGSQKVAAEVRFAAEYETALSDPTKH